MKKTYLNPEITIVNVQVAQMIAASTETLGIGTEGSANDAESRFFGLDDESLLW